MTNRVRHFIVPDPAPAAPPAVPDRVIELRDDLISSPHFRACPRTVGELPPVFAEAAAAAVSVTRDTDWALILLGDARDADDPPLRTDHGAILWWEACSLLNPARDLIFPAARYHTAAGRVLAEGGVRSPSFHQFAIDLAASELRGMLNFASLRLTGVLPPARAAADPTGEVTCLLIDGHRFLREYCRTPGAVRVRRVLGTLEPKILLEGRSAADAFERAAASARRREMLAAARDAIEKSVAVPAWDGRTLSLAGRALTTLRPQATALRAVLAAFEGAGWPRVVGVKGVGDLPSTVKDLNARLPPDPPSVRFLTDGPDRVAWEKI